MLQQYLVPSLGSRILIGGIKVRSKETSGQLGETEAVVRLCVNCLRNIQFIALPFKEVSLISSYVKAMHLDNDSRDNFVEDHENLAQRGTVRKFPSRDSQYNRQPIQVDILELRRTGLVLGWKRVVHRQINGAYPAPRKREFSSTKRRPSAISPCLTSSGW